MAVTDIAKGADTGGVAHRHELSVEDVIAQVQKIQRVMEAVMKEGEHYGKIPGVDKPSLWKAGAEKLCLVFRLDPQYESTEHYDGNHLTVKSRCTLWHIPTGLRMGSGEGSCSTKETKYAYRVAKRKCPKCGAETINKSKFPPRGRPNDKPGWYCHSKIGGCGAEFDAESPAITQQDVGRIVNDDVADIYNTVLKMANKRGLVAAVLNVTAASDIFTQDLEDYAEPVATAAKPRGEVIEERAERVAETASSTRGAPSYEPFGALTMVTKMAGQFSPEALEECFGAGVRNKSALEKLRADSEALYRVGYDKLHKKYEDWKREHAPKGAS